MLLVRTRPFVALLLLACSIPSGHGVDAARHKCTTEKESCGNRKACYKDNGKLKCGHCGEPNEPCCPDGRICYAEPSGSSFCNPVNDPANNSPRCIPRDPSGQGCGEIDNPCCEGADEAGLACWLYGPQWGLGFEGYCKADGSGGSICTGCNVADQPCCPEVDYGAWNSHFDRGIGCLSRASAAVCVDNGSERICVVCGGAGEPCCEPGSTPDGCDLGTKCVDGTCEEDTAPGTPPEGPDAPPSTPPDSPPSGGQVELWQQCGGRNYDGPTECASGVCTVINEWHSQCEPGT